MKLVKEKVVETFVVKLDKAFELLKGSHMKFVFIFCESLNICIDKEIGALGVVQEAGW